MTRTAAPALEALERVRAEFGPDAADAKRVALETLERTTLRSAAQVRRLHECLCFMRAYPDDALALARVDRLLADFARRRDLRRHASRLANSGIAGCEIRFTFFSETAGRLAERHKGRLRIDWASFEQPEALERILPLLVLYPETAGLDEYALSTREWVRRLKGPGETDAEFVLRRFRALGLDAFQRETFYDGLGLPLRLLPGVGVPSRTTERFAAAPVVFHRRPLDRGRPDLRRFARKTPRAVVEARGDQARRLVELARDAMVARVRDLDAFCHGDPGDVRRVQWEEGLEFAVIGVVPERRLTFESVYAYLTLRNGVPIGYVLVSALFGSSEIAYNVFDTWRGAEAARIYARVLATTRHLFGSDTFTIFPYQLGGFGNDEGLDSGAWWFYRKLGFGPRETEAAAVARREEDAMRRDPAHRSSRATLRRLAEHNLYFSLGRDRPDVIGELELANVGLRVTRFLSERFGAARERGARACARDAARRLGVGSMRTWSRGERLWWERWAPLIAMLPGLERWSAADRRALVEVVRAKGGRRESDFVRRFDRHARLRAAVRSLAEDALT